MQYITEVSIQNISLKFWTKMHNWTLEPKFEFCGSPDDFHTTLYEPNRFSPVWCGSGLVHAQNPTPEEDEEDENDDEEDDDE